MLTAMRQLMNFIVSVVLICAGLYVLYEELFVRYSGIHGRYRPFGVGLVLLGSGVVWLWFYVVGEIVLKRNLTRGVGHCSRTLRVKSAGSGGALSRPALNALHRQDHLQWHGNVDRIDLASRRRVELFLDMPPRRFFPVIFRQMLH